MLNQQIPVKVIDSDGSSLLVHSIFYTLQGEGPFSGRAAVFVRLGGCNLQCPGCDTEYSEGSRELEVQALLDSIVHILYANRKAKPIVVITGGEPFRQNIAYLANTLIAIGHTVQIETNGTLPASKGLSEQAVIVCSPKTGSVNSKLWPRISAYKYVASADDLMDDGLPSKALGHTARPHLARPHATFTGPVYLQPMDEQDSDLNKTNMIAVVDSCLDHGYTLCLQTHKIVGVE